MSLSTLQSTLSPPLGIKESIKLSEEVELRLRTLESYDLTPVINRIRRKALLPDSLIGDAVLEYERLIGLCVLGHRGIVVPCEEVDEVWHTHMLFTREYTAFCRAIAGGYIHHSPPESILPSNWQGEDYIDLYTRYFECEPDSELRRKIRTVKSAICQSSVACSIDN